MLHVGVYFYLLNPHETTEFCARARADAECDGVVLPDLDSGMADTCGHATVQERSSEHEALELSACTQSTIQSSESRQEADWTDGSLQACGLHFLLTALALPVSEATHTNSLACPTAQFSMTHAPTGRRRSGHARRDICR